MANASKTHIGVGSQGKGTGTGAKTEADPGMIGENMILSNRDKSRHPDDRGLDSKTIQADQMQDSAANRRPR